MTTDSQIYILTHICLFNILSFAVIKEFTNHKFTFEITDVTIISKKSRFKFQNETIYVTVSKDIFVNYFEMYMKFTKNIQFIS